MFDEDWEEDYPYLVYRKWSSCRCMGMVSDTSRRGYFFEVHRVVDVDSTTYPFKYHQVRVGGIRYARDVPSMITKFKIT